MMNRPKQMGSALMMVVGLLTMIGMLGATFLIITRLDARQSMIIESKSQATPLGAGVVARAGDILVEYLKIGSDGPHSTVQAGRNGWLDMLFYPDDDLCEHLATDEGAAPHKSDILGTSTTLVDCDYDGTDDAYLVASGVVNSKGEEYYVAMKMIDLSGRLNVNVAGSAAAGDFTKPLSPANIDLRGFVGDLAYLGTDIDNPGIHNLRCGKDQGVIVPLLQFWPECGRRVLEPDTTTSSIDYLPFSVGDEVPLRWQGDGASARSGRFYKALKLAPGDVYDSRGDLTTYSISRPLVPRATSSLTRKVPLDTSDGDKRQAIYDQVFAVSKEFGWFGDDTKRAKVAAHFVANLWAYQSPGVTDAPWAVSGGGVTAYGLVPDIVITDAFAKHTKDTSADPMTPNDDQAYGYAIEVMNPTETAVNLSSYKLNGTPMPNVPLGANGGRKVIYNYGGGANKVTEDVFFGATTSSWQVFSGVDFSGTGDLRMSKTSGGTPVPVDQVSSSELGYSCANKDDPVDNNTKSKYRDDRTSHRSRYNIAVYKDGGTGHKLGQTNGIADSEFASTIAKWSAKIIRTELPLEAVGELGRIYFTGPELDGTNLVSFSYNMAHAPITLPGFSLMFHQDKFRGPGRTDYRPIRLSGTGGWGPTLNEYPDVPFALEPWLTVLTPYEDESSSTKANGVYGLLNINTASKKAMEQLPFPTSFSVGGTSYNVVAATAVDYIYNYREKLGAYSNRASGAGINYLRDDTQSLKRGYFYISEVAVPLGNYANALMGGVAKAVNDDYIDGRDAIYRAISNSICVQSDSFALYIRVQLGKTAAYTWTYLAIIDTSTCEEEDDRPTVLMFAEIR